jgi:hypothetical protein
MSKIQEALAAIRDQEAQVLQIEAQLRVAREFLANMEVRLLREIELVSPTLKGRSGYEGMSDQEVISMTKEIITAVTER